MLDQIRKYNLWDGNVPELGFLRTNYTDQIHAATGNKLVKVLIGQRRAGKSFVLRQLAKRLMDEGVPAQNILYINKVKTSAHTVNACRRGSSARRFSLTR